MSACGTELPWTALAQMSGIKGIANSQNSTPLKAFMTQRGRDPISPLREVSHLRGNEPFFRSHLRDSYCRRRCGELQNLKPSTRAILGQRPSPLLQSQANLISGRGVIWLSRLKPCDKCGVLIADARHCYPRMVGR